MSKENVKLFFEKVEQDEQLQERLKKVQTENKAKAQASIVNIGKETGYDFSTEDLQQVAQEVVASIQQNEELDDAALEAVSGGSAIVIGAFIGTVLLGVTVVGLTGIAAGAAVHNSED